MEGGEGWKSCEERSLAFSTAATRSGVRVCFIWFNICSGLGFGGWLGGVNVDVVGSGWTGNGKFDGGCAGCGFGLGGGVDWGCWCGWVNCGFGIEGGVDWGCWCGTNCWRCWMWVKDWLVSCWFNSAFCWLKRIDLGLGLSLGPLVVISTAKLALRITSLMWCHWWWMPWRSPHRFRIVHPAKREHGDSDWIRDKIWRKQQTVQTMMHPQCHAESPHQAHWPKCQINPMDSLRSQPSNYVHMWTPPETIKRKKTTPKVVCLPGHFIMMRLLICVDQTLEQQWKRMLSRLPTMQNGCPKKKVSPWNSGQLFNTSTVDRVKIGKWPAVALYLDELRGWKM